MERRRHANHLLLKRQWGEVVSTRTPSGFTNALNKSFYTKMKQWGDCGCFIY